MNTYANYNQGFNPNRAPAVHNHNHNHNQVQSNSAPVTPVTPVNMNMQSTYTPNNNQQFPQGQIQGQRQDFSNYKSQYQGGGRSNINRPKKVYDRFLLNKFKEFDSRPDIEGAILYLQDQLRPIVVAGLFPFEGVYFIKMPYDTYFQNYLKEKYHIAWYKHAKLWVCSPSVAQDLAADIEKAKNNSLVMPDGLTYGFPQKKPYNNNFKKKYQQFNSGHFNNNYQQPQNNNYSGNGDNYQFNSGNFNNNYQQPQSSNCYGNDNNFQRVNSNNMNNENENIQQNNLQNQNISYYNR